MHFSTRQFTLSTRPSRQCLCPLVWLDNRLLWPFCLKNNDWYLLSPLMRYILPLDNFLCRLDNACVHFYDSYVSTTDCKGPTALQTRTDIFSVSLVRCIFPLDNFLCRLDSACVQWYDSTTDSRALLIFIEGIYRTTLFNTNQWQ